ncbi:LysR family transcriptional regulator [Patulibacter defluvii]|uniref:LysR family transcriptional regulator n=1 Tax=Patulibacter defluvii TaxID=3095358 RepID=UPI002A75C1EA|nr:LysR family transcriptional regulator [Patulibacter sp. DM4]
MEVRQLRYFATLAEELHFTRAAARLHIAQPALSQQIRRLEDAVGVALVDRSTHRVALTAAGQALLARARTVLAEVDAARAELADLAGVRAGRLTVGITPTPGPLDLPGLLAAFHAAHPEVELDVREGLSVELAAQLRGDALDLAFVTTLAASDRAQLETTRLAAEPLVAAVPTGHRLAEQGSVALADLAGERLVAFPRRATIRELLERRAAAAGLVLPVAFEVGGGARARALVARGLAVAVLPHGDATAPGPAVAVVPLADQAFVHEVHVAQRHGRRPSPAAHAMRRIALDRHR